MSKELPFFLHSPNSWTTTAVLPQNWHARALHSKFGQLDELTPPSQLGFRASSTMESKSGGRPSRSRGRARRRGRC
jgi:hypothetical protein